MNLIAPRWLNLRGGSFVLNCRRIGHASWLLGVVFLAECEQIIRITKEVIPWAGAGKPAGKRSEVG